MKSTIKLDGIATLNVEEPIFMALIRAPKVFGA
jgi:hypothetical protein